MPRRLEAVGYWFNELAPSTLPRPQRLVGSWAAPEREAVAAYLRAGAELERYPVASFCRFACGVADATVGCCDLTDGTYVWPEGLAHYVEVHAVRLPDHVVAHVLAAPSPTRVTAAACVIDEGRWRSWGLEQGACLELDGWAPLAWVDQRKVLEQLTASVREGHPLFGHELDVVLGRRPTRELVCRLADGRLAIVGLGDGASNSPGPSTTVLAGWDAWPASRRGG